MIPLGFVCLTLSLLCALKENWIKCTVFMFIGMFLIKGLL